MLVVTTHLDCVNQPIFSYLPGDEFIVNMCPQHINVCPPVFVKFHVYCTWTCRIWLRIGQENCNFGVCERMQFISRIVVFADDARITSSNHMLKGERSVEVFTPSIGRKIVIFHMSPCVCVRTTSQRSSEKNSY